MIHNYLLGKQELLDEKNRKMQLDYYLVEDARDEKMQNILYGIQITKKMDELGIISKEKETTPALSHSKTFVEKMILQLMEGQVTPMCLIEVVDDLMGDCLISG